VTRRASCAERVDSTPRGDRRVGRIQSTSSALRTLGPHEHGANEIAIAGSTQAGPRPVGAAAHDRRQKEIGIETRSGNPRSGPDYPEQSGVPRPSAAREIAMDDSRAQRRPRHGVES